MTKPPPTTPPTHPHHKPHTTCTQNTNTQTTCTTDTDRQTHHPSTDQNTHIHTHTHARIHTRTPTHTQKPTLHALTMGKQANTASHPCFDVDSSRGVTVRNTHPCLHLQHYDFDVTSGGGTGGSWWTVSTRVHCGVNVQLVSRDTGPKKRNILKRGSGATSGVLLITKQHSNLNDDGGSDES